MEGENDTSETFETDNADPQEADTPDDLYDYYDPDEDTVEDAQDVGTDDEVQAGEETEEQSEVEEEAEEEDDEQANAALVTLTDGTQVTHDDLVRGYLRQSDYTRKAQNVSNQRKQIEADADRLEAISQTIVDALTPMVPPMPDIALSYTDPTAFSAQKAQHDVAMARVQELIAAGDTPRQMRAERSEADQKAKTLEEHQKLMMARPDLNTQKAREEFFGAIEGVGSALGFSGEELSAMNSDHRLFLLADWAAKGMAADKAMKAAKAKAEKAAPAAPRKPGQPAKAANRNRDAMRKLSKSGSMRDALAVDFD